MFVLTLDNRGTEKLFEVGGSSTLEERSMSCLPSSEYFPHSSAFPWTAQVLLTSGRVETGMCQVERSACLSSHWTMGVQRNCVKLGAAALEKDAACHVSHPLSISRILLPSCGPHHPGKKILCRFLVYAQWNPGWKALDTCRISGILFFFFFLSVFSMYINTSLFTQGFRRLFC